MPIIYYKKDNNIEVGTKEDWKSFERVDPPLNLVARKQHYGRNMLIYEIELLFADDGENKRHYKKEFHIRYRCQGGGVSLVEEYRIDRITKEESENILKEHFGGGRRMEECQSSSGSSKTYS